MPKVIPSIEKLRIGAAENCDQDAEHIVLALLEVATQLARINDLFKAGLELEHSPELVREFLAEG